MQDITARRGIGRDGRNVRCAICGRYIRPDSPQRAIYVGWEDEMVCRRCERDYYEGDE